MHFPSEIDEDPDEEEEFLLDTYGHLGILLKRKEYLMRLNLFCSIITRAPIEHPNINIPALLQERSQLVGNLFKHVLQVGRNGLLPRGKYTTMLGVIAGGYAYAHAPEQCQKAFMKRYYIHLKQLETRAASIQEEDLDWNMMWFCRYKACQPKVPFVRPVEWEAYKRSLSALLRKLEQGGITVR